MAQRIDLPPNVVSAGYGKRFFAYLIDMVVIALGIVAFYFLVSKNAILPAVGFDQRINEKDQFLTSTKLTKNKDSSWGKLEYQADEGTAYGYELYAQGIWYYCTDFLPNHEDMQMNPEGFALSSGLEYLPFLGNRHDPANVGKWTWANFFETTGLFEPVKDAQGNPDYTQMPKLQDGYKDINPANVLLRFHNKDTNIGSYDDAYAHLFAQTAVTKLDKAVANAQWLAYIPAVLVSPFVFNFLVPLFFPKGKTFGKLFLGLAVVTDDGFVAPKSRLAIRYGVITVCYALLVIQNYWIAILGLQLIFMLLFATVALSGTGQGMHDIFASTVCVDEKQSKIFRTKEGRDRYIENNPDSQLAEFFREKTSEQFMEEYGDRMEDE